MSRLVAGWLFLLCGLFVVLPVAAAEIDVKEARISLGEEGWQLDAEFTIELGPRFEEIVARGVPLHFIAEFELTRTRWYWADEHVAGQKKTWRLAYNALTRQYRLYTGSLHQSFDTLNEALAVLSRLRDWPVADEALLKPGEAYNAAVRMRLDVSQLPKPFQINSIGGKDWNVAAQVKRWSFTPPAVAESPAR